MKNVLTEKKRSLIALLVLVGCVAILFKHVFVGAVVGLVVPVYMILFGDSLINLFKHDN